MGIIDFTNALFDSANTSAKILDDYTTNQAKLSTQNKQIQFQADINAKLNDIRQRSDYQNWQKEMNDFFQQVKNEMTNPESKYYCKNNMQGEMFNRILAENQLGVTEKVNQMVIQREMEKDIVDSQNSKALLSQMYAGQQYIDKANEIDKELYEAGRISIEQYQNQKDINFMRGYQDMYTKTFDASLDKALEQNKSFEAFFADIQKSVPEMRATDVDGLEKVFDKSSLDEAIKKTCQQNYKARLSDMQQKNADALSGIVQAMRQENTQEGKVSQARRGQMAMNGMKGLKLSESDRLQYSAIFELALGGDSIKGSGSGGSNSANQKYEDLIKAAPDTALQMVIDGDVVNTYDAVGILSSTLTSEWYNKDYKENAGMDEEERQESFNFLYKGRVSNESLTDAVISKVVEKYPTIKSYVDKNFQALLNDMSKNPKEYGDAAAGDLADFLIDTVMGADRNMTDEDILNTFKSYVNNCYVEKCKYVELDKKGNLEKTFNAKKAGDIAKAARLAQENDYVFTFNGQERWAPGKKEALEAKGGIIDTLKNAVAGTLDIPETERGKIGYYFKPDAEHNDLTSTPIITYDNKAYEVIPDDNDKGFSLRDYRTGEIIEGKIGGEKQKVARGEAKAEAKTQTKEAHANTQQINEERNEKTNNNIQNTNTIPNAVEKAGKVKTTEWKTGDLTTRQIYLRDTANAIDKDAKQVKKNKMTSDEFKSKYGIDYTEWQNTKEERLRYNLILNS